MLVPRGRGVVRVERLDRTAAGLATQRVQLLDLVHELALALALLGDRLDHQGPDAPSDEQVRVGRGRHAEGIERLLDLEASRLAERGVVVELASGSALSRRDLELPRPQRRDL